MNADASATIVYTIGHSNLAIQVFVERLLRYEIPWLMDVRTFPSSPKWPQFNRPELERSLAEAGIQYRHDGAALGGGRPREPELCSADGMPDDDQIEASARYRAGIEALCALARKAHVPIMGGEGNYRECHREKLIAHTLRSRDVAVLHILPDGTVVQEPQKTSWTGDCLPSGRGGRL